MKTRRLFYAAELPRAALTQLEQLQQALVRYGADGRWVSRQMLHITLHFIGGVQEVQIPALCRVLDGISDGMKPIEIGIRRMGCFSQSRGKLIYAAADVPVGLTEAVGRLKEEAGIGDMKPFKPHITLMRSATGNTDMSELNACIPVNISCTLSELVLFESAWERGRPVYIPLHRVRLE